MKEDKACANKKTYIQTQKYHYVKNGKVVPVHTMKVYMESRSIAPLMPKLGTRQK